MASTATLTAISCAMVGSLLLVRRMAMLGDAITHAALPGLAVAFLITGSRDTFPMLLGAVLAALATSVLARWISAVGRVEEHASLGIVFTTLFAFGLVLMVRVADRVDLDPSCVLYGALELTPLETVKVGGVAVPRAFLVNAGAAVMVAGVCALLHKEFLISAFDPTTAAIQGFRPRVMDQVVAALGALVAVAGFETVGSILVVALLVVPAATARLITSRFGPMMGLSVLLAAASVWLGHLGALELPKLAGFRDTNSAGMAAVAAGLLFGLALFFSPEYGLVVRSVRAARLRYRIGLEDALASLYRREERGAHAAQAPSAFWLGRLRRRGWISQDARGWRLTEEGLIQARALIRSHRLWETFLVNRAKVPTDQAHIASERLEHVTPPGLRESLDRDLSHPSRDPQGREIPRDHLHG
ncbi:MAG: metal ABC transporter permease [Kiritimatiellae bacterium]|nr:metal ABC transporter permease [Kiritimatiellia bacterium]MDW8458258.1 metal ABC transporter permease [Verrucomicrobiota bacterium]